MLHINCEVQDGVCILRLEGRFVTGSDAELARGRDLLKNTGCTKAVADFKGVPYLDSTGISFMIGLYTSLRNAGGQFAAVNLSRRILDVLEITRIRGIIPVYENEQAGIAAVRQGQETNLRASS